jgi:uncharacterized protein YjbJ (UPF0337 family)
MENWSEKKCKLKEKFAIIMDNDLNYIEGHKEDMLVKLQCKLGKTKEELVKIIEGL